MEQMQIKKRTGKNRTKRRKRTALSLLGVILCMAGFTACGQGDVSTSSVASGQSQAASAPSGTNSSSAEEKLEEKDVEDSLEGLTKYMANRYELGEAAETRGDMIGAQKKGYRYVTNTVLAEFYEFDPADLNETAKAVIESVKTNNTFTIMEQEVKNAYLSENGKYLMIYTDRVGSEDAAAAAKKAVEEFQAFKK